MFEYVDVDRLDTAGALDVVERAQVDQRRAEVQQALGMVRVVKTYRHQIPADKVQLSHTGSSPEPGLWPARRQPPAIADDVGPALKD
jgi:hypothetical protein